MRAFLSAIIFGLLTSAAYAQKQDPGPLPVPSQKIDEQAYRDSIKRIPDQERKSDPWGTVRDTGGANNKNKKPLDSK